MSERIIWEYTALDGTNYAHHNGEGHSGELPAIEDMDRLGMDGWELVCCMPAWGNDPPTLVFKRPKKEE